LHSVQARVVRDYLEWTSETLQAAAQFIKPSASPTNRQL
jgi:hypothetical protein